MAMTWKRNGRRKRAVLRNDPIELPWSTFLQLKWICYEGRKEMRGAMKWNKKNKELWAKEVLMKWLELPKNLFLLDSFFPLLKTWMNIRNHYHWLPKETQMTRNSRDRFQWEVKNARGCYNRGWNEIAILNRGNMFLFLSLILPWHLFLNDSWKAFTQEDGIKENPQDSRLLVTFYFLSKFSLPIDWLDLETAFKKSSRRVFWFSFHWLQLHSLSLMDLLEWLEEGRRGVRGICL